MPYHIYIAYIYILYHKRSNIIQSLYILFADFDGDNLDSTTIFHSTTSQDLQGQALPHPFFCLKTFTASSFSCLFRFMCVSYSPCSTSARDLLANAPEHALRKHRRRPSGSKPCQKPQGIQCWDQKVPVEHLQRALHSPQKSKHVRS